jgi:osmotically-inducible protein OsmY
MKWILGTVILLFAIALVAQQETQYNAFPGDSSMMMEQQKPSLANNDVLHEIQSRLSTNSELNNTEVTATVTDDAVILDGFVSTPQQRDLVTGIASEFTDNRQIIDHVQVGGFPGAY